MNGTRFDALARRAVATVSRRASLFALGAAAVGAIASPGRVEAGKNCGKKCNRRCSAQDPYCAAAVSNRCQGNQTCLSRCINCCFSLRNCDQTEVGQATTCLLDCAH
jgi:hypothetical protein